MSTNSPDDRPERDQRRRASRGTVTESDFLSELRSFIGTKGSPQVARDPVNMPMGDVYSALAKGVLDGVIAPADTFKSLHFADVAGYALAMSVPRVGATSLYAEPRWFMVYDLAGRPAARAISRARSNAEFGGLDRTA